MFCQDHYSKTKTVIFIWSKLFLAASLRTGTSLPFHVQMRKAGGSETGAYPPYRTKKASLSTDMTLIRSDNMENVWVFRWVAKQLAGMQQLYVQY